MSESSHLIDNHSHSTGNGQVHPSDRIIGKEIELRNLAIGKSDDHQISDVEESLVPVEETSQAETSLIVEETFTDSDIIYYYICTIIHVILVEYALLVIECSLKSVIYLIISILSGIVSLFRSSSSPFYYSTYQYFREGMLCFSATITLIIPFTMIFIYRQLFLCKIDFDLCPLPTLLGWVDSRRFLVVCYGSGSSASNIVRADGDTLTSMDSWTGDILFSPEDIRFWILQGVDDAVR